MIKPTPNKSTPASYGAELLAELTDVSFKRMQTLGNEEGEKRGLVFDETTLDRFQMELLKKDIELDNVDTIEIPNKFTYNPTVQVITSIGTIEIPSSIGFIDNKISITFIGPITGILKLR